MSTIVAFPPIVLVSTFTYWTIGPISKTSDTEIQSICHHSVCGFCKDFNSRSYRLSVSFGLTWVNVFLTLSFSVIWNRIAYCTDITRAWFFLSATNFAVLFLILIQFLDGCISCSSSCCESKCFPVRKLTYLDVEDMDLQETKEDIVTVPSKLSHLTILIFTFGLINVGFVFLENNKDGYGSTSYRKTWSFHEGIVGLLSIICGILRLWASKGSYRHYHVLNICVLLCLCAMVVFALNMFSQAHRAGRGARSEDLIMISLAVIQVSLVITALCYGQNIPSPYDNLEDTEIIDIENNENALSDEIPETITKLERRQDQDNEPYADTTIADVHRATSTNVEYIPSPVDNQEKIEMDSQYLVKEEII